jgi:hypothetical protein
MTMVAGFLAHRPVGECGVKRAPLRHPQSTLHDLTVLAALLLVTELVSPGSLRRRAAIIPYLQRSFDRGGERLEPPRFAGKVS